jgi:hypothetical protein
VWVSLYAVAMAFVEAAVVVYLRTLYHVGDVTSGVLVTLPHHIATIETGREAATIVMLLGVAALAGSGGWERFLFFCLAFGVWDLWYYAWLWVLIGWPASLLTWDVLFLIPVPWSAPVLAPAIVSLALVAGSLWALRLEARGRKLRLPPWVLGLALVGAALVLLSFTLDYRLALAGQDPTHFRWWLFGAGVATGGGALVAAVRSAASVLP